MKKNFILSFLAIMFATLFTPAFTTGTSPSFAKDEALAVVPLSDADFDVYVKTSFCAGGGISLTAHVVSAGLPIDATDFQIKWLVNGFYGVSGETVHCICGSYVVLYVSNPADGATAFYFIPLARCRR